jgi:hypothetical protein
MHTRSNEMKKVWQVENVSNGWAIYMVDQNTEYLDADGDNLLFDTKEKAQWFVDELNINGEVHQKTTWEQLRARAAIEMLKDAEVMHEFDDCVWIKVGIYKWEQFNDLAPSTVDIPLGCGTPILQELQDRIDKASKDAPC